MDVSSDRVCCLTLTPERLTLGNDPGAAIAFRAHNSSGMRSPPSPRWMPQAGPSMLMTKFYSLGAAADGVMMPT